MLKTEDNLGAVLVQVQDDLRQLRTSLAKVSVRSEEKSEPLDIQALDDAIQRTETCMKKHAEDCFEIMTGQLRVLPVIEDLPKTMVQIPKWKPSLERIPDLHPHQRDHPGASSGKKHKSPFKMRSVSNPAHPSNKTTFHKKWGTSLPDVHMKNKAAAKPCRMVRGSVLIHRAAEPKVCCLPAIPQEKNVNTGLKSRCRQQLKREPEHTSVRTDRECTPIWTARTPPPSTVSKSMEQRDAVEDDSQQNVPAAASSVITRYPFTIIKGQIDPLATDFCHFKQSFTLCWRNVVSALEALNSLLRDFAVPSAKVSGELLVELSHGWVDGWGNSRPAISLLSVLENREEVLGLVSRPGQRYKGEGGVEAAAIRIQSCWRRHVARRAYLGYRRRKWAAGVMVVSWLMRVQMRRVRKALQARRCRELENGRRRAEHLAANWKHIQSSKRTIIHIPSLGYCQSQRLKLMELDILQNAQMGRLCDIRDENVEVIYICPQHLGDNILRYYISLLKCDGAADGADIGATQASPCTRRFRILTPEAVDFFPTRNMCLSTLLKYSPRTLKRIKSLIQGKQAYIVGGVAHVDDLAVADVLGVPILGPEPAVAQLYSTKSGGRRVFAGAEVDVPPGQGDIYSLNQLHKTLAELMAKNIAVKRWLFKIDCEHGGRGTAHCDVCHLSCYNWALQEYQRYGPEQWSTEWIQEPVLLRYLDEVPEWLAHYARPAKTSSYPNWAGFLKTFLRQGGVVEACPPSDSVTCLTVDLLLEPGGEVTMLSCGDQLHGSCQLETIGSTVPQTSVHPDALHSICTRVGRACLQRLIGGHVSVDLATFLDFGTKEQKVWAVDLDLSYSDQLAMTQMLLMITGGTLNCRTGCLDVPMPISGDSCEHKPAAKPPVDRRYAVIGSHLFHSNLSMLYHHVFLKMCRVHGIHYNMKRKQGTAFALYDCSKRCSIGMIAVSEDLQGALVTFARSLSVIHQEISSCKIQGETNFKEVIRRIEDVLQLIAQNKKQEEGKPAG